jgi:hypothetical protein
MFRCGRRQASAELSSTKKEEAMLSSSLLRIFTSRRRSLTPPWKTQTHV